MVQASSGLPTTIRRFLRWTPTDPPRAIVRPRTLGPAEGDDWGRGCVSVEKSGKRVVEELNMGIESLQGSYQFVGGQFSFVLRLGTSQIRIGIPGRHDEFPAGLNEDVSNDLQRGVPIFNVLQHLYRDHGRERLLRLEGQNILKKPVGVRQGIHGARELHRIEIDLNPRE